MIAGPSRLPSSPGSQVWVRYDSIGSAHIGRCLEPRHPVNGLTMFEFRNRITIDKPVPDVFEIATDLTKLPRWNYFVLSVTPTSGTDGKVGSTYHQVRKSDEQDLRITEVDKDRAFAVETIPPSKPELRRRMSFQALGDRTVIEDHWQLELGVPKLLEPIAGRRVKGAVAENLGKLKDLLERGSTTLQDGRTTNL